MPLQDPTHVPLGQRLDDLLLQLGGEPLAKDPDRRLAGPESRKAGLPAQSPRRGVELPFHLLGGDADRDAPDARAVLGQRMAGLDGGNVRG
jgi:hypothetical protein